MFSEGYRFISRITSTPTAARSYSVRMQVYVCLWFMLPVARFHCYRQQLARWYQVLPKTSLGFSCKLPFLFRAANSSLAIGCSPVMQSLMCCSQEPTIFLLIYLVSLVFIFPIRFNLRSIMGRQTAYLQVLFICTCTVIRLQL